jgi:hypothetical protein
VRHFSVARPGNDLFHPLFSSSLATPILATRARILLVPATSIVSIIPSPILQPQYLLKPLLDEQRLLQRGFAVLIFELRVIFLIFKQQIVSIISSSTSHARH